MKIAEILLGAFLIIFALVIITVILLQEGRRSGVAGAVSGGADTFLSKNKAHTLSAKLQRITKYITIIFLLLRLTLFPFSANNFTGKSFSNTILPRFEC